MPSLQTGAFAGPVGSSVGQPRFHRTPWFARRRRTCALYTPRYGLIEMRARPPTTREHGRPLDDRLRGRPERSAEICICEIFGRESAGQARSAWASTLRRPEDRGRCAAETVPIDARESTSTPSSGHQRPWHSSSTASDQDRRAVACLPDAADARPLRVPRRGTGPAGVRTPRSSSWTTCAASGGSRGRRSSAKNNRRYSAPRTRPQMFCASVPA